MAANEYPFRHQSTFYAYELNTAAAQQNVKNTKRSYTEY